MFWMSLRPLADDLKTSDQGLAGAAVVEILYMHHLEARLAHQPLRVEVRVLRQASRSNGLHSCWVSIASAFAVGIDVEFDLAYTGVQLLIKRAVPVFECCI